MKRNTLSINFCGFAIVAMLVSFMSIIAKAQTNARVASYFATVPVITDIKSDAMTVEWGLYNDFNKTTHYQVNVNNTLYGFSTKNTKEHITGLKPGRTAKITIVTYHNGKLAGVSSPTSVLTPPAIPKALTAYNIGSASVGLIWQKSISATKYNVYEYPNKLIATVDGASNSVLITGLTPGASTTMIVTAVNSGGESYMSSTVFIQLMPEPPVLSVESNEIGNSWFVLHWTPVEKAVEYTILINDEEKATVGSQTLEYELAGLATGTAVSVKMKAINDTGASEFSEPIIIQLLPDTPVLSVVSVASHSCTLRWSAANGASYYKVYLDKQWAIFNVPSTIYSVSITENVVPGSVATYSVKAVNGTGETEFSNSVAVTYTSTSIEAARLALKPDFMACGIREPKRIAEKYRGQPVVVVQFPNKLHEPELTLEAHYLSELAETKAMSNVKFLAIFTGKSPNITWSKPKNIRWLKSSKKNTLDIKGSMPVISFYDIDGWLQHVMRISMIIITEAEIYKWLPCILENGKHVSSLYHEVQEKFDELHQMPK